MKKILLIVAALFVLHNAKAQSSNNSYREDSWHLVVGPSGLVNVKPGSDVLHIGYGAEGQLEYYPTNYVGVTVSTGYLRLIGAKPNGVKLPDFSFVPIRAGLKGFVVSNLYLLADVGIGFASPKGMLNSTFVKTIAPGIGYSNQDIGLDISLKYENLNQRNNYLSMFGLNVAYSFNLSGSGY
ncbi:porin family protein [Mucilaginibacter sp. RS28]|uniref:Porin family protein n=1 Tax=Mucilaginibacter straminoryzae TaxID=2932774 RepID=A0A9X1X7Y3_9SPHI|nr:porin family protein [Mucilaginibacter straminoryzae]MCJ8210244.1 porin family protein [Mucilaginibacter straminoryzae]